MNPTLQQRKANQVLWPTTSYGDLQAHCTCYLHFELTGSTAFLSIHHKIPYVHLNMSYTGLSPILSMAYRICLFSTLYTSFFLHTSVRGMR